MAFTPQPPPWIFSSSGGIVRSTRSPCGSPERSLTAFASPPPSCRGMPAFASPPPSSRMMSPSPSASRLSPPRMMEGTPVSRSPPVPDLWPAMLFQASPRGSSHGHSAQGRSPAPSAAARGGLAAEARLQLCQRAWETSCSVQPCLPKTRRRSDPAGTDGGSKLGSPRPSVLRAQSCHLLSPRHSVSRSQSCHLPPGQLIVSSSGIELHTQEPASTRSKTLLEHMHRAGSPRPLERASPTASEVNPSDAPPKQPLEPARSRAPSKSTLEPPAPRMPCKTMMPDPTSSRMHSKTMMPEPNSARLSAGATSAQGRMASKTTMPEPVSSKTLARATCEPSEPSVYKAPLRTTAELLSPRVHSKTAQVSSRMPSKITLEPASSRNSSRPMADPGQSRAPSKTIVESASTQGSSKMTFEPSSSKTSKPCIESGSSRLASKTTIGSASPRVPPKRTVVESVSSRAVSTPTLEAVVSRLPSKTAPEPASRATANATVAPNTSRVSFGLTQGPVLARTPSAVIHEPGAPRSPSKLSTRPPSDTTSDANSEAEAIDPLVAQTPFQAIQTPPHATQSDRLQLIAGAYSLQGRKSRFPGWPNQDVHLVVPISSDQMLAAVFDGHGREGHLSAARVSSIFEQHAKTLGDRTGEGLFDAFREIFEKAQETLERERLAHYAGTTATVALINRSIGVATVAHVGDSTLAIFNGSEVETTTDHRVDATVEQRVIAHGGEVRVGMAGQMEVGRIFAPGSDFPGLAMARSLGDQEAQRLGARFEPEFTVLPFQHRSILVIASDGVWDVLSTTAAAATLVGSRAAGKECVGELACAIVMEARRRYPSNGDVDDITSVVVRACPDPGQDSSTPSDNFCLGGA